MARLVPYDSSMRLGQGYNSYTQTPCVEDALLLRKPEEKSDSDTTPKVAPATAVADLPAGQSVTYSVPIATDLNQLLDIANIEYATLISNGSAGLVGGWLDEAAFVDADVNLVVYVKVINKSTSIPATNFSPIDSIVEDTRVFNNTFGDTYISGFVEGGEFLGLVSLRAKERHNAVQITDALRKNIETLADQIASDKLATENQLGDIISSGKVDTPISVRYRGGNDLKENNTPWTILSLFQAAAAFPNKIADASSCLCWATLTKYTSLLI